MTLCSSTQNHDLKKVKTQFGYHLIEVLDKKTVSDPFGFKVAYIFTDLVPSEATQNKTSLKLKVFFRE
jgi:parvulin-like peptidyl-prolyl isomerase